MAVLGAVEKAGSHRHIQGHDSINYPVSGGKVVQCTKSSNCYTIPKWKSLLNNHKAKIGPAQWICRGQVKLTKPSASQISEVDVSVSAQGVKGSRDTVAVEANAHPHYKQDRASCPTQERHDQKGVPQNEGIVQTTDQVEANHPWAVCRHTKIILALQLLSRS